MNPIREAMKNLPGHWHKGGVSDNKGNFCAVGHVRMVHQVNSNLFDTLDLMDRVAEEMFPDRAMYNAWNGQGAMPSVNDHPDTTEEDVLAVMEKAAIRFEEQI